MEIKSVMILAGGLGTRFKEYTEKIPKPMIKANGEPLLIHVSNIYKRYDIENVYILVDIRSSQSLNILIKILNWYQKRKMYMKIWIK